MLPPASSYHACSHGLLWNLRGDGIKLLSQIAFVRGMILRNLEVQSFGYRGYRCADTYAVVCRGTGFYRVDDQNDPEMLIGASGVASRRSGSGREARLGFAGRHLRFGQEVRLGHGTVQLLD